MKNYPEVAKRLRELRGDLNLSQKEFSKRLGIPFRTYQYYESGERIPKQKKLVEIAKICNTTVEWILTGKVNVEKAIIQEKLKHLAFMEDLVDRLETVNARIIKLKYEAEKGAYSKEDIEKVSKLFDFKNEEDFMDSMRKWIKEGREEVEQVNRIDQLSFKSPLYSLIGRIEDIYNEEIYAKRKGSKIEIIKDLLDALEASEGTSRIDTIKNLLQIMKTPPGKEDENSLKNGSLDDEKSGQKTQ